METNEIIKAISEEMEEIQLNEIIVAMCKGFERVNPQGELVCIMIPRQGKKERRKILRDVCRKVLEEAYDKATGAPTIKLKNTKKHAGDLNSPIDTNRKN